MSYKLLITGGAGFIGSHHVEACLAAGFEVAVLDNLSSGKKTNLPPDVKLYEVDILDKEGMAKVFADFQPTHISHHAAQVSVRRSLEDAAFDAQVNILGTINLLELAKQHKIEQFIFASSGGAIYGENETRQPAREDAPIKPVSPYAIAKLAAEHYIRYFADQAGFKATILRYGNVYGPRQDPVGEAGVICQFLGRFTRNEPTNIYGTGEQVRDFVFVKDVAAAHLAALQKGESGIFNVGSGVTTSVNQIHAFLSEIWKAQSGQAPAPATPHEAIKGEIFWSSLNIDHTKNALNWAPSVTIENGLKETTTWFRSV